MKLAVRLLALALLSGCSTNPITGREQILVLPAVQAAHAEASFALSTVVQGIAEAGGCAPACGGTEDSGRFAGRVAAVGARLEPSARDLSPELFARIGGFRIEVSGALGIGTGSSAGGRIALGHAIAGLEPTDAVLGFLIAREMAHVIARHAEENSGAAILFSALGILLPGLNAIAKMVATSVGSSALQESWAVRQQREADEIAVEILARAGLPASIVALELDIGVNRARLPESDWGARYIESTERVERIAAGLASYAALDI